MEDRKKHAHFQDKYRRSSNFGKMETESSPNNKKDGTIVLNDGDELSTEEIRNTVDSLSKDSNKG